MRALKKSLLDSGKQFTKIAFYGVDRKHQKKFKKEFSDHGFGIAFFDGLEDAKGRLLPLRPIRVRRKK